MKTPFAVDLYCGLGGWTDGLIAAGWDVYGFDITRHVYGESKYPDQLILQDALTIHGSQFRNADLIVASPPCQAYSYLAMPWSRSKCPLCKGKKCYFEWQLIRGVAPGHMTEWGRPVPCDCKENSQKAKELRRKWETEGPDNRLFDACFRIQLEACEAAGRYIPLIVENVRGAVPWVGPAKAKFGSFYLWGDVAQVGDRVYAGSDLKSMRFGGGVAPGQEDFKGGDGSWFAVANNTNGHSQNPVHALAGQKRNPDGTAHPQGSWFRIADSSQGDRGQKVPTYSDPRRNGGKGVHLTSPVENKAGSLTRDDSRLISGRKGLEGKSAIRDKSKDPRPNHGTNSNARKAASSMIAKIPLPLSRYIGEVHKQ